MNAAHLYWFLIILYTWYPTQYRKQPSGWLPPSLRWHLSRPDINPRLAQLQTPGRRDSSSRSPGAWPRAAPSGRQNAGPGKKGPGRPQAEAGRSLEAAASGSRPGQCDRALPPARPSVRPPALASHTCGGSASALPRAQAPPSAAQRTPGGPAVLSPLRPRTKAPRQTGRALHMRGTLPAHAGGTLPRSLREDSTRAASGGVAPSKSVVIAARVSWSLVLSLPRR
jgi:hypothetical protein